MQLNERILPRVNAEYFLMHAVRIQGRSLFSQIRIQSRPRNPHKLIMYLMQPVVTYYRHKHEHTVAAPSKDTSTKCTSLNQLRYRYGLSQWVGIKQMQPETVKHNIGACAHSFQFLSYRPTKTVAQYCCHSYTNYRFTELR